MTPPESEHFPVVFSRRVCPLCGSERASCETFSRPRAESAPWGDLQRSWAGFFQTKLFFSYLRCDGCGLLYCREYFTPEQLGRLYGSMADNTAGLGAERMLSTQTGYADLIQGEAGDGDFLELGPDIGLFTAAFVQRFDRARTRKYWLFEPNLNVHEELRRRLPGQQLAIRTNLTDLSEIPDRSLGAVVMIHVLDHLLEPGQVLADLRKKMRPGARFHIVTHSEGSLLARALGRKWPAFCLQHPQLYRPQTITQLLVRSGFTVDKVQRTTNYFPVIYLLRHGLYALGVNLRFLGRVDSFSVGVRLGNIMTSAHVDL